jgi:ubiquinone biosynthesis protein
MLQQVTSVLKTLERMAWQMRAASEQATAWSARGARLSATSWMLAKIVADYRSFAIYSAFMPEAKRQALLARIHRRSAKSFYNTSTAQLGAFLKVGQLLSARPDVLPDAWIEELAPLQDAAPAISFDEVRVVVEAEIGAALTERFAAFDEKPLAAASIGQVHRAVTRDGKIVAVKVQRPGIGEVIEHDLALLELFIESLDGIVPPSDYATIAAELRTAVRGELDYGAEADAMAATATFFAGTPGVRVPRVFAELSGPRVLVSEFVAGEKITVALERVDERMRADILGRLLAVYLRQILDAGRFQADPHPGNFLVTPDGQLVLLDFGCMRTLDAATRAGYRALVRAFIAGDDAALGQLFAQLGFATASGRPDTLLRFAEALLSSFRRGAGEGRFTWPTRDELYAEASQLADAARLDPVVKIPSEFVLIGRVFGTLAGLFQHYRPAIDFTTHVFPHL